MMKDSITPHDNVPAAALQPPDAVPTTFAWKNGRLFYSSKALPWNDGEDEAEVRQRAGFRKHASIELGDDFDSLQVRVFGRLSDSDAIPQWLADITIADQGHLTWIDDATDLLDLLRHLAPTVAAVATLSDRSERVAEEREQRRGEARERSMWKAQ